ncbi:MAG: hypothetical protein AAB425_15110 [Bdellovibrionota bacterium]
MKKLNQWILSPVLFAAVAQVAGSLLGTAHAGQSVNVQSFSPSTSDYFVLTEDGLAPQRRKGVFTFGLNHNFVNDPLVATDPDFTEQTETIVDGIHTLDTTVGIRADSLVGVYLKIPLHLVRLAGASNRFAFGDAEILSKWRFTPDESKIRFSLLPGLTLPTGRQEFYVSNASLGAGIAGALEWDLGQAVIAANLGFKHAGSAVYENIDFRNRVTSGFGVFVPIGQRWGANAEFVSQIPIPYQNNLKPSEFYVGALYRPNDTVALTGGASIGKIGGPTGQDYRIILGLRTMIPEATVAPVIAQAPAAKPPVPPRVVFREKEIELKEAIEFENNSDRLTEGGRDLLREVAHVILANTHKIKKLYIDGHTNHLGS